MSLLNTSKSLNQNTEHPGKTRNRKRNLTSLNRKKEENKMADRNLKFETRQLHVGQEQADPTTDARAVPIYATTS